MDLREYIDSGILELYVAGALSEKESKEVYAFLKQHPELLNEVESIEAAIIKLTAAASPVSTRELFDNIKSNLGLDDSSSQVIPLKPKTKWFAYVGWAAAVVLGAGLLWLISENNKLENQIKISKINEELLEVQIEKANNSLQESKKLIAILRDRNIITVPLEGQTAYPEAYARVYWDKNSKNIYLDVQGLPIPPDGKVYQVWSLILNPLTPTSLGTLDNFNTDENKIFTIANDNASEAFGITLEPAGGSESPTLEQLYTLGAVKASS